MDGEIGGLDDVYSRNQRKDARTNNERENWER